MAGILGAPNAPILPDPKFNLPTDKKEKTEKTEKKDSSERKDSVEGEAEVDQEAEIEQEQEVESEEEDQGGDEKGGGGGGGTGDDGSGDSGTSGGQQDGSLLFDATLSTDGTGVIGGTTKAHAALRTAKTASSDQITTAAKASVPISVPANTKWIASLPALPGPGSFNLSAVESSIKGNQWLASSFLVTLTVNMFEIAKLQSKIKAAESKMTVDNMKMTMLLAKELGNLIMEKAEKEAEMHMMMAVMAIISFAVATVGFAVQVGGTAISTTTKAFQDKLKMAKNEPTPGADKTVAGGQPFDTSKADTSSTRSRSGSLDSDQSPGTSTPTDGSTTSATPKVPWYKNKMVLGVMGNIGGAFSAGGQYISGGAHGAGMADSFEKISTNIFQAKFKKEIGEKEQLIEIKRAQQQLARQALDAAIKGYADASQILDSVIQLYQKMIDEGFRAHSLGRG